MQEMLEELFEISFECLKECEWSKQQYMNCYRDRADRGLVATFNWLGVHIDEIESIDAEQSGRRDRKHHHGHNHHDHHGHREHHGEQVVIDLGRHGKKHRHRETEYECRVEIEDPMRRDEIARQCCEEQQLGRYNPEDQTCEIEGRDDKDEFQQCAVEQGAMYAECVREPEN